MKTLILSPHVDDELYGCLGYIVQQSRSNDVTIAYITKSEDQRARYEIARELYKPYGIKLKYLGLFLDGEGNQPKVLQRLTKVFDTLTEEYDTILVNSKSNHQDHNIVYDALMISLRTRPKLKSHVVLEYDYCYNQLSINQLGCVTYYFDDCILSNIKDIWGRFENQHSVSKGNKHVTHFSKSILLNQFLGSYREMPYAERFRIVKYDIINKEWNE